MTWLYCGHSCWVFKILLQFDRLPSSISATNHFRMITHLTQHNQLKSENYSMRRGLWRGRKIPKKYWLLWRISNLYCGGWISIFSSSIFSRFHFYFPTTQSGHWAKIWKIVILGKLLLLTILFIINVLEFYSAMM